MKLKINLKGCFNNAQLLPQLLADFVSDIDVSIDHYVVDGKSLFGVLSLNFNRDLIITIHEKAEGEARKIRDVMRHHGFLVEEV